MENNRIPINWILTLFLKSRIGKVQLDYQACDLIYNLHVCTAININRCIEYHLRHKKAKISRYNICNIKIRKKVALFFLERFFFPTKYFNDIRIISTADWENNRFQILSIVLLEKLLPLRLLILRFGDNLRILTISKHKNK